MTLTKLRRILDHLTKLLPQWTFTLYSQKEVEALGDLDPPCALLRAWWGPYEFDLHVDGEGEVRFVWGGTSLAEKWFPRDMDMSQKPSVVAADLIRMFDEIYAKRGTPEGSFRR